MRGGGGKVGGVTIVQQSEELGVRGGDRETATTQVKEVETATGQQGGVQLGGQLWPSGQWQMRPVVVVGGNAAPEKAASILWPPSHTQ